jgi:hypothetical protein
MRSAGNEITIIIIFLNWVKPEKFLDNNHTMVAICFSLELNLNAIKQTKGHFISFRHLSSVGIRMVFGIISLNIGNTLMNKMRH